MGILRREILRVKAISREGLEKVQSAGIRGRANSKTCFEFELTIKLKQKLNQF